MMRIVRPGFNILMPLYLSNRPIQKDGGQARDGPSSVHMTRNQRPPGPPSQRTESAPGACSHSPSKTPSIVVWKRAYSTVLDETKSGRPKCSTGMPYCTRTCSVSYSYAVIVRVLVTCRRLRCWMMMRRSAAHQQVFTNRAMRPFRYTGTRNKPTALKVIQPKGEIEKFESKSCLWN